MTPLKIKESPLWILIRIEYDEHDQLSYRAVVLHIFLQSDAGTLEERELYGDRGKEYRYDSGDPIADFRNATETIRGIGSRCDSVCYTSSCDDFPSDGINFAYDEVKTNFRILRYTTAEERSHQIGFILDLIAEYNDRGEFDDAEQLRTSLVGQIGLSREIEQACLPEKRSRKRKRCFLR